MAKTAPAKILRKYMEIHGIEVSGLLGKAAYLGDIDILENALAWLKAPDINCDSAYCLAALGDRLDVMKWLDARGYPIDEFIEDCIRETATAQVVEWLDERRMRACTQGNSL